MMPQLAAGYLETAMAEEFENYEARLAEARRAVERWEAEGGAQETEQPAEWTSEAIPGSERTVPPGGSAEVMHDSGDSTEE